MSDIGKVPSSPECRPNTIKYPKPKTDKQIKKTKGKINVESKDKKTETPQHSTYVPDTNLTLACLVCLCFNLPLGAFAMYLSLSAAKLHRDGDTKSGDQRAKFSVLVSLLSIVTTVLIVTSIVLWIVIDNENERNVVKMQQNQPL
ncbi:hypothetical protein ACF0H5_018676 [Mactra antiquata]